MKKHFVLFAVLHIFLMSNSQEITVNFKSRYNSNPLDSIVVQNMRTNEKISIEPNNSLILTVPTTIIDTYSKTPAFYWKTTSNGMELHTNQLISNAIHIEVFDETGKIIIANEIQHVQNQPLIIISNVKQKIYFIHVFTKDRKMLHAGSFLYKEAISNPLLFSENHNILKEEENTSKMTFLYGDILECIGYSQDLTDNISISPFTDTCLYFSFMGTVTDIEDNEYSTIQIGNQTWFAQNLQTTTYADGTPIPFISDNVEWTQATSDGYCDVYNNTDSSALYGKFYNWYAVETEKLCPTGWHVPNDQEWSELRTYLIENGFNYDSTTVDNKIAKSIAITEGWTISTQEGSVGYSQHENNSTGFCGLPAGNRASNTGSFYYKTYTAYWWSYTQESTNYAYRWAISNTSVSFNSESYSKKMGYSVRCIKD